MNLTRISVCATLLLSMAACEDSDIDNGIANVPQEVSTNKDKVPIVSELYVEPGRFAPGTPIKIRAKFPQPAAINSTAKCDTVEERIFGVTVERQTENRQSIPYDPPLVASLPYNSIAAGSQGDLDFGSISIPEDFARYTLNVGAASSGQYAGKPAYKIAPILHIEVRFNQTSCQVMANNGGGTDQHMAEAVSSSALLIARDYRLTCGADPAARCVYALEPSSS